MKISKEKSKRKAARDKQITERCGKQLENK